MKSTCRWGPILQEQAFCITFFSYHPPPLMFRYDAESLNQRESFDLSQWISCALQKYFTAYLGQDQNDRFILLLLCNEAFNYRATPRIILLAFNPIHFALISSQTYSWTWQLWLVNCYLHTELHSLLTILWFSGHEFGLSRLWLCMWFTWLFCLPVFMCKCVCAPVRVWPVSKWNF